MLKKISIDSNIRAVLEETIPPSLIRVRQISGTNLQYVSGNLVIDALNRAFGYAWSWSIDHYWVQNSEPKKYKNKNTGEEITVPQVPVAHVIGTLTVFMKDDNGDIIEIKKSGAGSKSIIGGSSEQESIYKSASTDALKKASSLLGIGAQLYRDNGEQEYFEKLLINAPWDSETKEALKDDITWLQQCKQENGFTDDYIDEIISNWSGNKFKSVNNLPPYKFSEFVQYLKEAQKAVAQT